MRLFLHPNRESQRGSAMVLFVAILAFVLIPIVGLAIDGTILYVVKAKLVTAVDSAALATGRSLSASSSCDGSGSSGQDIASTYFDANFPANTMGTSASSVSVASTCDPQSKVRTVQVKGSATVPLLFSRIFTSGPVTVSASGQASRRDVNIVLVLDRSSSMIANNVCSVMKSSAENFVNMFTDGRDQLALITFMISPNLDYPHTQFFKSGPVSLTSTISNLQCGGNTGSAAALMSAYTEIQNMNEPGALNVIVFFTDGRPNGVTAHFPIKSGSTCQPTADGTLDGAIEQVNNDQDTGSMWTSGVNTISGNSNISGTGQAPIGAPGCAFATNSNNMKQDVDYMPALDWWGNSTSGYKQYTAAQLNAQGFPRVDVPTAITFASTNVADAAARAIRSDQTYRPVIYVIGLGGTVQEPLDQDFLQRVANVPQASSFDPTQPQGYYAYAPNAGQLGSAFQTIASQILHISQ